MFGAWGEARRSRVCVVLMLTTVGPCFSARSVKSGSSRPCACSAEGSQRSSQTSNTLAIAKSSVVPRAEAPGLTSLLVVLHRVGDVFYALCRRLADHRDPVIADRAGVDVDCTLPRQARLRRLALARGGLDEHRDRGEAVREHDVPHASGAAD